MVLAVLMAACAKNDPEPAPELKASTQELATGSEGGPLFFHVAANRDWQASSTESWCTLATVAGEPGTTKVEVTVAPHSGTDPRGATITVVAGPLTAEVVVVQEGATQLQVGQATYEVNAEGGEITVEVAASGAYEVSVSDAWLAQMPEQGTSGTETFHIDANRSLFAREATILFTLDGVSREIAVAQQGQPVAVAADNSGMTHDALALVQQMGVGWNLGNTLEAASSPTAANETLWGNPKATQELIDAVKAAGFNAVRIPCAWSGYMEDQTDYRVKDSWLARVKEVVDYCVANDMYVILNTHWDGGWLEEHPLYSHQAAVTAKFTVLWQQIAVYFRDYDEHLLFAGTNEVHADYGTPTAEHLAVQNSYNQTFVDAVRATGGRNAWRNLVVQSYNTNIDHAVNHLTMPSDAVANRLAVEVHYYDPYDFTIDGTSDIYLWGNAYAGRPNVSTWGQEDWADEAFGKMKTHFVDRGIPVILGEYAPTLRSDLTTGLADHLASRHHYLRYVTAAALENGMVPFYWDNGHTGNLGSGLFDRAAATPVHTEAIAAIISAVP